MRLHCFQVGMPIPVPSVIVYNLLAMTSNEMAIGSDNYVTNIMWANKTAVAAVTLNRLQNTKTMKIADFSNSNDFQSSSYLLRVSSAWVQNVCTFQLHYMVQKRASYFIPLNGFSGRYFVDVISTNDRFSLILFDLHEYNTTRFAKSIANASYDVIVLHRVYNQVTNEVYVHRNSSTAYFVIGMSQLLNKVQTRQYMPFLSLRNQGDACHVNMSALDWIQTLLSMRCQVFQVRSWLFIRTAPMCQEQN